MQHALGLQNDCIAALATPLGESALAIIRTSGAGSIEKLAQLCDRPEKLSRAAGNTILYGHIQDPQGSIIDQVLFSVFRAPHSYTGEDGVEISCHGSIPGVQAILELLFSHGFRQAEGGEFTLRAFLNGKMDLTRAEAVHEIVSARTKKAQSMAMARLSGTIEERINTWKSELTGVMAAVSVQLDYPEDEVESQPIPEQTIRNLITQIRELSSTYLTGRLFQQGALVALAGRTNAGKSSLFNAFLREDRSIVSEIHGTTRDYIEAPLSLQGIPIRLVDTAGLRRIDELIESEGIRRTTRVVESADLVVYVVDGSVGLEEEDLQHIEGMKSRGTSWVGVWNKCDKKDYNPPPEEFIQLSTQRGQGIMELQQVMYHRITGGQIGSAGDGGDAVIDSARQHRLLEECAEFLGHVEQGIADQMPLDVIALDVQGALNSLGEITGEVTREDVLDRMFSGFCVGK
ncbi:tRNA uridine-5-carboxymethylaminomethyl(34) synthesis GTPase MnmE [Spirochaeta lutea]|uniref:tRNA modification GTPase MnmE n=1 Tax=Spirochaeta lutea TaxID=1480694 RepID=A0A098R3S1_9SPIO|nr:tRNA uridine-5-carboxymethylaminomethyl(34) synthesis GTPase MnmE [Spirochaeta lutea]KGE73347.1 hypothetical protein DC28_04275 [Spirochaeta lutea]